MIAFQNTKTGRFYGTPNGWPTHALLADAYPWHENDEGKLRAKNPHLAECRTVIFSTRIDHPDNNPAKLSAEDLAQRYPRSSLGRQKVEPQAGHRM